MLDNNNLKIALTISVVAVLMSGAVLIEAITEGLAMRVTLAAGGFGGFAILLFLNFWQVKKYR